MKVSEARRNGYLWSQRTYIGKSDKKQNCWMAFLAILVRKVKMRKIFSKRLLRLSSQKPKTSRLTTPLTSLRITLILCLYFPRLCTMYCMYVLCTYLLFLCHFVYIVSSYVEVKTVSPTLICFLVYLFHCR
jgi:hypothetical protein